MDGSPTGSWRSSRRTARRARSCAPVLDGLGAHLVSEDDDAGPRRSATSSASRPCRRCCASRTARSSSAPRAGCATGGRRSPASRRSAPACPSTGPAAAAARSTRPSPSSWRSRHGGSTLRSRRVELGRARGRGRGDVRPGLDRRPAGRAADRGPGAAHARGHEPRRPTRSSPSCRPTSSSAPSRRWRSTRCSPAASPSTSRSCWPPSTAACTDEFNVHGAAGHDDAGRAGADRQRPDPPPHRDEQRRQRARPGQPGQRDDRPRPAARHPQRRRRPPRRGRPGRRRATPASSRSASPRTRRARRSSRCRCRGACPPASTPSRCSPARGRAGIVDQLSRDPESLCRTYAACLRTVAAPEAADGLRRHPRGGARARPGVPRGGLGPGRGCWPGSASCCTLPGDEVVRGAGGIAEGLPERRSRARRCRSSATAACWSSTPAAAPACSRPSSAAGRTAPSAASPSPWRSRRGPDDPRSDRGALARRPPAGARASTTSTARSSACSTSASRAATCSSTGWPSCSPSAAPRSAATPSRRSRSRRRPTCATSSPSPATASSRRSPTEGRARRAVCTTSSISSCGACRR